MRNIKGTYYLCLLIIWMFVQGCSQAKRAGNENVQPASEYYTVDDLKSLDKIDAHIHLRSEDATFVKQAEAFNFRLLNVNVYTFAGTPIEEQQRQAIGWMKAFPGRNSYATTFSLKNYNEDGWQQETIDYLKNSFQQGAIAVKIWKNIGMELKDKHGRLVTIDNPRFDPVLKYLEENKIPVLGHIGEPRNCWLPVEKMTVLGDKNYFTENPKYHMYLHPELPSYEDQVAARDRMLERHPRLKFIGAHLGSLEWSVDELAKRLDKFPNMAVDMAARIPHFKYQAISNRQKVRDFFIKYQDRLLYGTDVVADKRKTSADIVVLTNDLWAGDWRFFVTDETLKAPQVEGAFKGLKLPRQVIDKIYWKNAENWFPGIVKS